MRWLRILSWPIWAKLLAAFAVLLALALALVLMMVVSGVREVSIQNAAVNLTSLHDQQRAGLSDAMLDTRRSMDDFIYDPTRRSLLQEIMPDGTATADSTTGSFYRQLEFVGAFRTQKIAPVDSVFTSLELLDANGILLASADRDGTYLSRGSTATTRADSAAFIAGQNAELQGQRQVLAIEINEDNELHLYVVNLIRSDSANSRVLGYIVADIYEDIVIGRHLLANGSFGGVDNYLAIDNSHLLTTEGIIAPPAGLQTSGVLARALGGRSNMETFGENENLRLYRYASVGGTAFALISVGPAETVAPALVNYLQARGFALAIGIGLLLIVLAALVNQTLAPPLRRLRHSVQDIARGNLNTPIPGTERTDEIGALSVSVADMREQITLLVRSLEHRLSARENEMSATHEISHFAATQRDLEGMMAEVVELIVARFDHIYHAQIFLVDREGEYAVLRASSGLIGRTLLERGHRLLVGSVSVIGQVIDQAQPIIARDTATSRVHRRNEFLLDTQAELAIPLIVSGRVIGALDVQSKQRDVFDEKQISILQMLADQIATAIDNARLYQEALYRTEEAERNRSAALYRSWREHMAGQRREELVTEAGIISNPAMMQALREQAIREGQPVIGQVTDRQTIPFAVPIRLSGHILGAAGWELPEAEFNRSKVQLAQELTDRLAISLDNARLFQESQRATERERRVNDIAARLTTRTDIDDILQTAVREVGQALRSPQVSIRLNTAPATNGNGNGNGSNHTANGTNGKHS